MGRSSAEPRVFEFDANTDRQQTYYLMMMMVMIMTVVVVMAELIFGATSATNSRVNSCQPRNFLENITNCLAIYQKLTGHSSCSHYSNLHVFV